MVSLAGELWRNIGGDDIGTLFRDARGVACDARKAAAGLLGCCEALDRVGVPEIEPFFDLRETGEDMMEPGMVRTGFVGFQLEDRRN